MESSAPPRKLHLVFVPYPSQGHITPMMQLAKLLHSRGFHITFVHTDFNYRRLLRSRGAAAVMGLPGFQFEAISDGLPPSDADATQDIPALCESTRKHCLAPFRELLLRLASTDRVPAVTGIVSDGTMTFATEAAREIGVAQLQLWTASACSFMGYLHYRELVRRGIFPFKDANFKTDGTLDTPIDWIPGMRNIRLKDLPSHIRTTDPNYIMFDFMGEEAHNCLKAQTIIFNTFDALEHEVLEAIAAKFPHIFTIGPLPMLCRQMMDNEDDSLNPNLWKEDSKCIEWLDQRDPNSVVYVNYGSVTVMSGKNFREFAWGLAKSNHPFLWVVRPDIVMGGDDNLTALSEEFLEDIKGRGLLVSWCSQVQVLRHASVGVFLTHCGWNSTLESISEGVPVICWPFFADQQTNCRYACAHWGIGMELDNEVKCEEVASTVKEMMEGNGGKKMRSKAKEWKEKAEEAIGIGGSSYNNFDKFMKELVL